MGLGLWAALRSVTPGWGFSPLKKRRLAEPREAALDSPLPAPPAPGPQRQDDGPAGGQAAPQEEALQDAEALLYTPARPPSDSTPHIYSFKQFPTPRSAGATFPPKGVSRLEPAGRALEAAPSAPRLLEAAGNGHADGEPWGSPTTSRWLGLRRPQEGNGALPREPGPRQAQAAAEVEQRAGLPSADAIQCQPAAGRAGAAALHQGALSAAGASFVQRLKSVLSSPSTAVDALESPGNWPPFPDDLLRPDPLEAAAVDMSGVEQAEQLQAQANADAAAACQRALQADQELLKKIGSLRLTSLGEESRKDTRLQLELRQLEQQLAAAARATSDRRWGGPALLQRAVSLEQPIDLAAEEESVLLVSASESTAASSAVASLAESAQGLDIIGEGDFVGGLAQLPQEYYDVYREATDDDAAASRPKEVLVTHERSNVEILRRDMACMKRLIWLNDEIINVYMALLIERDRRRREEGLGPKCHFFKTFFANKLYKDNGYLYKPASRWTKPIPLGRTGQLSDCVLDLDLLLVPVHQGAHWVCAAVDLEHKRFVYYDSLKGEDPHCLKMLAQWLRDEYKDKRGESREDVLDWPRLFPKDIPQQMNCCDCGMFAILFADYASQRKPMDFTQQDIDDFRVKFVYNILRLEAD